MDPWRIPASVLGDLRSAGTPATMLLTGWGLRGIPPRAELRLDVLLVEDAALGDGDFVVRGGDGTLAGAGRIYRHGYRAFIESDFRYSRQPDLPPDQPPLARPAAQPDGQRPTQLVWLDVWERTIHAFQDRFLEESALGGDETGFRTQKVTQVRSRETAIGGDEALPSPIGRGLLTTNVGEGERPDRYPPEDPDPCRDRCLFTENLSTGEGYLGQHNVQVRIEVLRTDLGRPVIGWSRENASVVVPLAEDAGAGNHVVKVAPVDAERFTVGDVVVIEDEWSRLDGERDVNRSCLRRLRAVNAGTGELELEPSGVPAATTPAVLDVGGALDRSYTKAEAAAVRRWDGVDWLLTDVRYNLVDGITFAFDGDDFRLGEYWTFVARVADPDGSARGDVEPLTRAPVHGPWHERVALSRVVWSNDSREFVDLRVKFLPLHEVRDRLIELGRRRLSPGAFTIVVGDGRDTFGDIDQNIAEGVTGDEAIQAAVNRLATLAVQAGSIYIRAGVYTLEHPVLVQRRASLHILGDGDASELQVTGAGGAFYFEWCGGTGEVSLEMLQLIEMPEAETPIGTGTLSGDVSVAPVVPGQPIRALRPDDLVGIGPVVPDLVAEFGRTLKSLDPYAGRASASVVATIARLRRLQQEHPGRPLEDVAPDELAILRRLPHGVVTVANGGHIRLERLTISSREEGAGPGTVAAGVLLTGRLDDVAVSDCRIDASSGVVASPYGMWLQPRALVSMPRAGLWVRGLTISGNDIVAKGASSFGVRVADGLVEGVGVHGNRVEGFAHGIVVEDRAESRDGEAVDRTVVHDNLVVGATTVGVLASGDGLDIEANEIRVGNGRDVICAGIQVTGTACRVRNCWISFSSEERSALGLHAGIMLGSGADGDGRIGSGRPVEDVEVEGNRVDGGGSLVTGVLIGGSQPVYDVRVVGNSLRNLGDAGVRAWAHGGAIGGLRIEENTIESVALSYVQWGEFAVAELRGMAEDVAIASGATPRDALDALVGSAADLTVPLDVMLRWLEQATLRGGVVLSLVEESEVRRNRIVDVGTRELPAGFVNPGTGVRTAGVTVAGGRDITVEGNVVQRVQAPVQVIRPEGPIPPKVRPPIFDKIRTLGVMRKQTPTIGIDLHGAAVALRHDIQEYASGSARVRQRLGSRHLRGDGRPRRRARRRRTGAPPAGRRSHRRHHAHAGVPRARGPRREQQPRPGDALQDRRAHLAEPGGGRGVDDRGPIRRRDPAERPWGRRDRHRDLGDRRRVDRGARRRRARRGQRE